MKIFISWSGETSKAIASTFKEWIPAVIQAAKPYFSPNDIDKGARWSSEIAKELEAARVGLICLTAENLQAPWIMFEAGALSKSLDKTRVCPMLFGVDPTDLSGPLVQFQATSFSKEEVHKVIKTINGQLAESALDAGVLDSVFEKWWPDLEERIQASLKLERKRPEGEIRSDRNLLEEILKISRALSAREREPSQGRHFSFPPRAAVEIVDRLIDLMSELLKRSYDSESLRFMLEHFDAMMRIMMKYLPDEYGMKVSHQASSLTDALQEKIRELEDLPF